MQWAVLAILIFASAGFFIALAETALFSLSKWQVGQLAEQHPRRGRIVSQLLQRPLDLLAMLAALGNTFANAAMLLRRPGLRSLDAHRAARLDDAGPRRVHLAGLRGLSQNHGGAAARALVLAGGLAALHL